MRLLKHIFLLCLLALLSCEDVINVDLKTANPKLVIDASINWKKGTDGSSQSIKLSLTAPFFDNEIPPANGAIVIITDSNNNTFNFIEDGNSGIYRNTNFIPEINGTYSLTINYNSEIYKATETLKSVVPIDFVEQKNDGGFSSNEIELKAFYTDPGNIDNYYLFEYLVVNHNTLSLEVYDDEFTDGNQIFAFYSDEEIGEGDEIIIKVHGISQRSFEFLTLLLQQTDDESGDPFETQPATVRGNCVNQTNPENFPLGYFRLSETDEFIYIVE